MPVLCLTQMSVIDPLAIVDGNGLGFSYGVQNRFHHNAVFS